MLLSAATVAKVFSLMMKISEESQALRKRPPQLNPMFSVVAG